MRYIKPEIEISAFDMENIVTISGAATLKTSVVFEGETKEGTSYGNQDFSIYAG